MSGTKAAATLALLAALLPCAVGCEQNMWDGSQTRPLEASSFFADGRSARPLPPDTVPRRGATIDALPADRVATNARTLPVPLTAELLDRGQKRYETYCAECHGYAGYGDGIIVRSGFPPPPTYHSDRLRNAPPGYFYDVITNGYGVMYPYRDRVSPADRWAIIAYIRALQLSQNATPADVPDEERRRMDQNPQPTPSPIPTPDVPLMPLPGGTLNGKGVNAP